MIENLVAGYLAYTTAEEFGADGSGSAPASTPALTVTVTAASVSASVSYSVYDTLH